MAKIDAVPVKPETEAKARAISDWQVREIELALADPKAGAPGVTHERMAEYLGSWGTDRELPSPDPEKGA